MGIIFLLFMMICGKNIFVYFLIVFFGIKKNDDKKDKVLN